MMKSQLLSLPIFAFENGEGGEARRGHIDAKAAKWWVANPPYLENTVITNPAFFAG
jgi:hypothetical protein